MVDLARESVYRRRTVIFQNQVAIAGFYSNTHEDCQLRPLQGLFGLLFGLLSATPFQPPTSYGARPGAPSCQRSVWQGGSSRQKRLLLLISDGKPTDYDRYEGAYRSVAGVCSKQFAKRAAKEPL